MGIDTGIEWADHTANFWVGCTQVSPACDHCYAKSYAERFGMVEWNGPPRRVMAGAKVVRAAQRIAEETGVKQFVFVNSLSDFFDNQADPQWRLEAIDVMRNAPDCIFLLLTKRIGIAQRLAMEAGCAVLADRWPPNAWLGITVINQEEADRDIWKLLRAKRDLGIPKVFLSIEPMLGPIELTGVLDGNPLPAGNGYRFDCMVGCYQWPPDSGDRTSVAPLPWPPDELVDWVICGGESGPGARPMHPDWARSLRDQCASAGVPFLFKQHGDHLPVAIAPDESAAIYDDTTAEGVVRRIDGHPKVTAFGGQAFARVGKHAAGRLLDGVEHNGRPQP